MAEPISDFGARVCCGEDNGHDIDQHPRPAHASIHLFRLLSQRVTFYLQY